MGVNQIGGITFVNQNMQIPATQQADFQQKLDAQAVLNMELANEGKKEIEQIRPTEETYEVDPDREHEKQKNEQNLKDGEDGDKEEIQETQAIQEDRILDISV